MPSESVLKVLIALNAIQMFITLLLVATMASAGLTSQSATAVGALPMTSASADPYGAWGSSGGAPPPAANQPIPPGDEAADGQVILPADGGGQRPELEGQPPGDEPPGGAPPGGEPPGGEPPSAGGAEAGGPDDGPAPSSGAASSGQTRVAHAERTKVIMRTYLNLVSRRLQMSATDAGVDPAAWLPTEAEIDAAVESGDAASPAFAAALDKLRPGYAQLEMEFPSPPAPKAAP